MDLYMIWYSKLKLVGTKKILQGASSLTSLGHVTSSFIGSCLPPHRHTTHKFLGQQSSHNLDLAWNWDKPGTWWPSIWKKNCFSWMMKTSKMFVWPNIHKKLVVRGSRKIQNHPDFHAWVSLSFFSMVETLPASKETVSVCASGSSSQTKLQKMIGSHWHLSSRWFQPIWKILVKLDHFPR